MDETPLITCPKCNTVMDRSTVRSVEIDVCAECGGIWLDRGELIKLKLKAGKRTIDNIQDCSAEVRKVPPTSGKVRLPCPVCEGKLVLLQVDQVAVEICDSCGGLYLDHGELTPVLTALGGGVDMETLDALIGIKRPR
jgi:Zn-finger nucleic acid-binding protein